jgi:hypothetical protein
MLLPSLFRPLGLRISPRVLSGRGRHRILRLRGLPFAPCGVFCSRRLKYARRASLNEEKHAEGCKKSPPQVADAQVRLGVFRSSDCKYLDGTLRLPAYRRMGLVKCV